MLKSLLYTLKAAAHGTPQRLVLLLGLLIIAGTQPAGAATGIFEGYVFLSINNGGINTYDLNPSTQTAAFDFVGPARARRSPDLGHGQRAKQPRLRGAG